MVNILMHVEHNSHLLFAVTATMEHVELVWCAMHHHKKHCIITSMQPNTVREHQIHIWNDNIADLHMLDQCYQFYRTGVAIYRNCMFKNE